MPIQLRTGIFFVIYGFRRRQRDGDISLYGVETHGDLFCRYATKGQEPSLNRSRCRHDDYCSSHEGQSSSLPVLTRLHDAFRLNASFDAADGYGFAKV